MRGIALLNVALSGALVVADMWFIGLLVMIGMGACLLDEVPS